MNRAGRNRPCFCPPAARQTRQGKRGEYPSEHLYASQDWRTPDTSISQATKRGGQRTQKK